MVRVTLGDVAPHANRQSVLILVIPLAFPQGNSTCVAVWV